MYLKGIDEVGVIVSATTREAVFAFEALLITSEGHFVLKIL